jgi:hypothetical protein
MKPRGWIIRQPLEPAWSESNTWMETESAALDGAAHDRS